jgi:hypothetical protein
MTDVVSMETGSTSLGEDYQKLENAVLYWHKTTGYIYDPVREVERGGRERKKREGERARKKEREGGRERWRGERLF